MVYQKGFRFEEMSYVSAKCHYCEDGEDYVAGARREAERSKA